MKRKVMILVLIFPLFLPAMGFTGDVEVTGVWVSWTMRGLHSYDFKAEITVRNNDDRDQYAHGRVEFYDRNGGRVHSTIFYGKVRAGERVNLVKKGTVSAQKREKIDYWEATVR